MKFSELKFGVFVISLFLIVINFMCFVVCFLCFKWEEILFVFSFNFGCSILSIEDFFILD